MNPAVKIKQLSRFFKAHNLSSHSVRALDSLDLEVPTGQIFALLGRNGAGKTTLLKVLSGLILPSRGSAEIVGLDIVKDHAQIKKNISLTLAAETHGFYWRLSGLQNLKFFAALYNLTASETKKRIDELINMFELEDLDKRFDYYSTGQKNRFCLARNFFHDPQVIFMDEPTRSLDPVSRTCLKNLIRKWTSSQGKTFFFTTHDIREAEVIADRAAILHEGKIVFSAERRGLNSLEKMFYDLTGSSSRKEADVL